MNILTQSTDTKMTSQQIADLVGSRHDVVRKSIERLATDKPNKPAVIQLPPMTEVKQNQSTIDNIVNQMQLRLELKFGGNE